MNFSRNIFYWGVPLLLWLMQAADQGGFEIYGRGLNHNELLVRDKSASQAKQQGA
jgi:hypothetical protein